MTGPILLQAGAAIDMYGLMYVEHSSAASGSELQVTGSLQLAQRRAMRAGARSAQYAEPVLFGPNATDPYQLVRSVRTQASHQASRSLV